MFTFIVVCFLVLLIILLIDFQSLIFINNFSEANNDYSFSKIRAKRNH